MIRESLIICLLFFLTLTCKCNELTKEVDLTSLNIVIANDASLSEKQAATTLQEYLRKYNTKSSNQIVLESEIDKSVPYIFVGWTKLSFVILGNSYADNLGSDGIVIRSIPSGGLILTGGRPRGTLYSVLEFLEQYIKIKFWTPNVTDIPSYKSVALNKINYRYVPPLNYRNHFVYNSTSNADFAFKLRGNGDDQRIKENYGGNVRILGYVHTFGKIIPPKKYFSKHPEWFSDPLNGDKPCTSSSEMPDAQRNQLCLTNESLYKEFLKNTLELIKQNPSYDIIEVSQNDSSSYCKSAACLKIIKEEGSPSGLIIRFVNRLANDVNKIYPGKKIMTLAYTYSLTPPKITKPGPNVIIRIATMASNFAYPLYSEENAENRDIINRWSQISKTTHYWGYNTNFKNLLLPHPSFNHIGEDLKYLYSKNVNGVFLQDNNYTNGVGYFLDMQTWVVGKLMWNPNLDQGSLVNEFMHTFYGAAAPYLISYMKLIDDSYKASGKSLSAMNNDYSFLTIDVMNKSSNLFKQALNSVKGNKILYERVLKENTVYSMSYVFLYNNLKRESLVNNKELIVPPLFTSNEILFDKLKSYGVKKFDRYYSNAEYVEKLKAGTYSRSLINDSRIVIQQNDFKLYKEGKLSKIIADPKASDEYSASISNKSSEWLVQAFLKDYSKIVSNRTWKVTAWVKVENSTSMQIDGNIRMGLFNQGSKKSREIISIPISKITGKNYVKIELKPSILNSDDYVWISIVDKKGNSKDLYIDKFELEKIN